MLGLVDFAILSAYYALGIVLPLKNEDLNRRLANQDLSSAFVNKVLLEISHTPLFTYFLRLLFFCATKAGQ